MPEPDRLLTEQSPVSSHTLSLPSVMFTVPMLVDTLVPLPLVMVPLVLPLNVDEPDSVIVSVESSPTSTSPSSVWSVALSVATLLAPDQPSSQTEMSTSSDEFVMSTPESAMVASVFVTWNVWPLLLVRLPPVIVKALVPSLASPDCDW